jgi:hypothetical protein
MTVGDDTAQLAFESDLPLPGVNIVLYRRIYVIEQWLRRVVLAALCARYGSRWSIPNKILPNLDDRIKALRNRVAFDTENSDNAVWCLTLDELKAMLIYEKIWPYVKTLTGFDRRELLARLDEMREIRNVIGHNRAATPYTQKIFDAIAESLDEGISRFRDRFIYDFEQSQRIGGSRNDVVVERFYATHSPIATNHIGTDEYFYYIYSVPRPIGSPIALGDLLEHFDAVRRVVLAFLIHRRNAGEFTVVWPREAAEAEHAAVLERFEEFEANTGAPYEDQSPKYVCHPKVWFVF